MFEITLPKRFAACALFVLATRVFAAEPDVPALLRQADAWRLADSAAQVETRVQTYKGDTLEKEKRYTVLLRGNTHSLVLFRAAGEAGQKVLMLGEDFWMLMPTSQRPIRITPMQKLLGEASTGDIATLTWSGDYTGTVHRQVEADGQPGLELELAATRKSLSYQRILLTVAARDGKPVRAELFAASGRKVKDARFGYGTLEGKTTVTSMVLTDEIQTGQRTVVSYLSRKPRKVPDEYFNPQFLVRNEVNP